MKEMLYIKDAKGKIRLWSIEQKPDGLSIMHGTVDGVKQAEFEPIDFGLASRSKQEQIQLKFDSKVKRRMEKGYVRSVEEAMNQKGRGMNSLGKPRPMLAQKYNPAKEELHPASCFIQPKLDGHRCLVSKNGDEIIAYSRNAKEIHSISHIIEEVLLLTADTDNIVLDGELYVHGLPLQKISSLVRKPQKESLRLKYCIYDIVDEFADFAARTMIISRLFDGRRFQSIINVPTLLGANDFASIFHNFTARGYEGIMIRKALSFYECGKRSDALLKLKKFDDAEFIVCGVKHSVDGWGILQCVAPNGNMFNVTAPGNAIEKIHVAENQSQYIGKQVTVEYASWTKDGIPFHPVAKCWRHDD